MSVVTPLRFFLTAQLTTSPVAQYTVPANTKAVVKRMVAVNITISPVVMSVQLTPSGGSAAYITDGVSIPALGSVVLNEWANMALAPGDVISAVSTTATAINLVASGFTVV